MKLNPRNRAQAPPGQPTLRQLRNGMAEFDLETPGARQVLALKEDIIRDLGGKDHLSAQQKILVDLATRTMFYIAAADEYLFQRRSLLMPGGRAFISLVEQRQRLSDSLTYTLVRLGLKKHVKKVTLEDFLRERAQDPPEDVATGEPEDDLVDAT